MLEQITQNCLFMCLKLVFFENVTVSFKMKKSEQDLKCSDKILRK